MSTPVRQGLRVAVFASGRGSNFQAILDAQSDGGLSIETVALCSDKPDSRAVGIAAKAGIPCIALDAKKYTDRAEFDRILFDGAAEFRPDLIVLAGFMRVIDDAIVKTWCGRMINIHPSLLPKYPGLRTHQRALDARDIVHGASVHFVTAQLDGGPVIAQVESEILADDDAVKLAARLLPLEHRLLVATMETIAQRRVQLRENAVIFDGQPLRAPLSMNTSGTLNL